MNLKKFTILNHNDAQQIDEKISILINMEHIVSVKPINMTTSNRDVIEGYWIRLSNGKKYKAIQVPKVILETLNEELANPIINKSSEQAFNYQ